MQQWQFYCNLEEESLGLLLIRAGIQNQRRHPAGALAWMFFCVLYTVEAILVEAILRELIEAGQVVFVPWFGVT